MYCPLLRPGLSAVVVTAGAALLGPVARADKGDDGFKPLFNGKDLTGWKTYLDPRAKDADPAKTWAVADGVLRCTGHPNGYFYTEKPYKDYVLRYDWRYLKPEEGQKSSYNSGALVHIQKHKIWPKCIEVQGAQKNHGFLYFIDCKKLDSHYDQKTKDKVTKPIGEWNTTEITCKDDGSIVAKINGTEVSSGKSDLNEGPIGFQSEGAEIHFRNIEIKGLK
jgi:hypothetical protein